MKIKFTKMHGIGNDFAVIDAIQQNINLTPTQIQHMADRHFGIGFDQLLVIAKSTHPEADFNYQIFNADGSTSAQCGNGARCIAYYIHTHQLSNKNDLSVATLNGSLLKLHFNNPHQITVDMGMPEFNPGKIPFLVTSAALTYPLEIAGEIFSIGAVSMGNPHAVISVADVENAAVADIGSQISNHAFFPERSNVEFMQIINRKQIKLRVYERGAGETLACGSGACAAVVMGRVWNLLDEKVTVQLPGGDLLIEWQGSNASVLMTGPAQEVFSGEWLL